MSKKSGWILVLVIVGLLPGLLSAQTALSPKLKKWIDEEVPYIITVKEKDVFMKLETDADRDRFIEEFWRQRDPTPGTPRNEFKDEHYRRIEYANKTFGRGTPFQGWRTERGRIYIILGPPVDVQRIISSDAYPMELWYYVGNPVLGQASNFRLLFFQKNGGGDYVLYNPSGNSPKELVSNPGKVTIRGDFPQDWDDNDKRAAFILGENVSPEVLHALYSLIPGNNNPSQRISASILLAEVQRYPQKKINDAYALDLLNHKATVEVSYSERFMGNRSAVSVIKNPSGQYFLHYVIVPDNLSMEAYQDKYFADLRTTIRVSDTGGRTVFEQEKNIPIDLRKDEIKAVEKSSFQLYDAFPIIPGMYLLNILVENTVSREFTTIERTVSIPAGDDLWMSPLIPSRKVVEDTSSGPVGRAFQIGKYQIYPSLNSTFQSKDRGFFFFQIHGLSRDLRETGLLDVYLLKDQQVLQSFRKNVRESENGRDFLLDLSLEKTVPGTYSIKVVLLDKEAREIISQETPFNVTDRPIPGTWVSAQENPPEDDPSYSFALGTQYLNTGNVAKAQNELAKAFEKKTDSIEYAVGYSRALVLMKQPDLAREILVPFSKKDTVNFDYSEALAMAYQDSAEYQNAILWFNKALSFKGNVVGVLNRLGECYVKIGDKDQAMKAWKKSLEINPNQENIKKLIEKLNEMENLNP
jgi:GWxTD domain-containing protein